MQVCTWALANHLKKMYHAIYKQQGNMSPTEDDQRCLSNLFRSFPEFFQTHVKFDVNSSVFMNLALSDTLTFDPNNNINCLVDTNAEKLLHKNTFVEPCFVHGPANVDLGFVVLLYHFTDNGYVAKDRGTVRYYASSMYHFSKFYYIEIGIVCVILVILIISFVLFLKKYKHKSTKS